jgi:hypothetical protein
MNSLIVTANWRRGLSYLSVNYITLPYVTLVRVVYTAVLSDSPSEGGCGLTKLHRLVPVRRVAVFKVVFKYSESP